MTNFIKIFMGCILVTASVKISFAQTLSPDSIQQIAYNNIVADFYRQIEPEKLLYNGPEYRFHPNSIRGNAYFNDNNAWDTGTVVYDSIYYENAHLMYDIYTGEVAVLLPNNYSMATLQNRRLSAFSIGKHRFINFRTSQDKIIKPGIYEQLFAGKVWALGKYEKTLQSSSSTSGPPEQFFRENKEFYILKDGKYYNAGSEGAALNAFADKKKELKQFIKARQIRFRKNPEQALAMIAAEYDRLTTATI